MRGCVLNDAIIRGGAWNRCDLSGASIVHASVNEANLTSCVANSLRAHRAKISSCRMDGVSVEHGQFADARFDNVSLVDAIATGINLNGATLDKCDATRIRLGKSADIGTATGGFVATVHAIRDRSIGPRRPEDDAQLRNAKIRDSVFDGAMMDGCDLTGADLSDSRFVRASLVGARLHGVSSGGGVSFDGADLCYADLCRAQLGGASFVQARLDASLLCETNLGAGRQFEMTNIGKDGEPPVYKQIFRLTPTNMQGASLVSADLSGANLVYADLRAAKLRGARVFGVTAWRVRTDDADQAGLVVQAPDGPLLLVDNLELAGFIYAMLDSSQLRQIIDTLTSKVVLILGRFDDAQKPVLETIRAQLASRHFVPVMFDFDRPANRDLTETVELLARMARFVVADITSPRSVPHELASFLPGVPSVPLVALLRSGKDSYAMFPDLQRRHRGVVGPYEYSSVEDLVARFDDLVIKPEERARSAILPPSGPTPAS